MTTEAKCPKCGEWSEIYNCLNGCFIYAMWAFKSNDDCDCPHCGNIVMFESECEMRDVSK
jgi:hypothetical protein